MEDCWRRRDRNNNGNRPRPETRDQRPSRSRDRVTRRKTVCVEILLSRHTGAIAARRCLIRQTAQHRTLLLFRTNTYTNLYIYVFAFTLTRFENNKNGGKRRRRRRKKNPGEARDENFAESPRSFAHSNCAPPLIPPRNFYNNFIVRRFGGAWRKKEENPFISFLSSRFSQIRNSRITLFYNIASADRYREKCFYLFIYYFFSLHKLI